MKLSFFKHRFLPLLLALVLVLPQSGCAAPIEASATEDFAVGETVLEEDTDTVIDDGSIEGESVIYPEDTNEFGDPGDTDGTIEQNVIESLEEDGFAIPEEEDIALPEDPLEALQYNIDRLPDPDFWETVTDENEAGMLAGKYGSFASGLMDEYYELSEDEQEAIDITRLEAYYLWETSLTDTLAGDSDRGSVTPQVLPESVYSAAAFPEEYSHLVLYTRSFYKADEVGSGYRKQLREYQSLLATNTSWDPNVYFKLKRVARVDEQDYDLVIYTRASRPATTVVTFEKGQVHIVAAGNGLSWNDEQPVIYSQWHFVNSDTGAEASMKGAITISDIDWHWVSDLGTGPQDPNNTSKRESVAILHGGVRAYLDANTHVCRHNSTFGAWNNFTENPNAKSPIGGLPGNGWYWGTDDEYDGVESKVTFAFNVGATGLNNPAAADKNGALTFAYYGSWHYGTNFGSTVSEIHYNIAPKSEWFPEDSDLSSICKNDREKNHCIQVDTNRVYGTYSVKQHQNDLTTKPGSEYIWHGWYTDKACKNPAPASWVTPGGQTSPRMLWGWWEKKRDVPEGSANMELTKELEQTGERMINNQDTWNIVLTQEYIDDTPMYKARLKYAPLGSYLNLVIDETTSMRGAPLDNLNTSLENMVDQVLAENQKRLREAKDGDYADIDGNQSDAALKADMDEHLVHIDRVVGFHSRVQPKSYNGKTTWNAAPTTEAEAEALKNAIRISESELGSGTGLSAALDWLDNELSGLEHLGTIHVTQNETIEQRLDYTIVLLDGMPDVKGALYSSKTTSAKAEDVKSSISTARGIKEQGVKIYGIWDRGVSYDLIKPAVEANNGKGDINELPLPCSGILQPLFMGMLTSDLPKGGNIVYSWKKPVDGLAIFYLDVGGFTWSREDCYSINEHEENGFGKYTYFGDKSSDVISYMRSITADIMAEGSASTLTTYAGSGSYVYDVISDPFEVTNVDAVQVYAVPRIPVNLDADGKPEGVETDKDSEEYGIVKDFRYGYEITPESADTSSPVSEWINVTSQVNVSIKGNVVKVSGWDYENNALTPFDKDLLKATNRTDPFVYEPGDYGYKIIVKVPINAKKTFGGNNIETNNSDVSGFYPSIPGGPTDPSNPDYVVRWPDNTEDNPDGNEWIKKYESPKVDLYIDYQIVADNINIYAPQTGEILNIVSDVQGSIWMEDPRYQMEVQALGALEEAYQRALDAANKAASTITESSTEAEKANAETLFAEAQTAKEAWMEKQELIRNLDSYRPDGVNNAFVNIDYTLTDPDGETVGTMRIPHGKAYVTQADGTGNIQWEIVGGNDRMIQKSGLYHITCTVTPVDTNRAPGGHVYTAEDVFQAINSGGAEANAPYYPYNSELYSPTGSTAAGRETAVTLEKDGSAYLYYLEIVAEDSRLLPRQTIDFFEGNEYMYAAANPHIGNHRWVCTDGVTESIKENEPGAELVYAKDPEFDIEVVSPVLGLGDPVIATSQLPQEAFDDGLAMDIMGTHAVGDQDGIWVPVGCYTTRKVGDINKSRSVIDRTKMRDADMTDEDNLWATGDNSTKWEHECDDLENCTFTAFQEAQKYSNGDVGKIRYLIHVSTNPTPDIDKSTSTPAISKGDDIKWEIELDNGNEETNAKHLASDFKLVDVLPFNNDDNSNGALLYPGGSKFGGDLKYTMITFDMSDAPTLFERMKTGEAGVYLTSEEAARTAAEDVMTNMSEDGPLKWKLADVDIDEETKTVSVSNIPEDTYAFNLAGRLLFGETVRASLTANVKSITDQDIGDYYHNVARVYTGTGYKQTDAVETVVGYLYISGTVWEDYDANGLIGGGEERLANIPVTLYKEFNPDNGGTPDRVIGNLKLTQAFGADQNQIPTFATEKDGMFHFDNVQKGTFYIVADNIPNKYAPTIQRAGTDEGSERLDSEADEAFVKDGNTDNDNSAIIRKVVVNDKSVEYQNIGLKLVLGNVKVWKTLDEIYYPTTMTEEEMEDYQLVFLFQLKNKDTGRIYKETVRMDHSTYCPDASGKAQVYAEFDSLPLGTYELTESSTAQYQLEEIERYDHKIEDGVVRWDGETKTMTIEITADNHDFEVHARNKLVKDPPGGDLNGLKNWVNVRVPVKLEIKYVGQDPISDHQATTYTFVESDFDPEKGGDMIVTYDDGTTISLSEGTLKFEDVVLTPGTVTNKMNSGINKVGISGYYSEKGRTVSDSFKVGVDLKPIHKFQLNFNANGSSFDDGAATNIVHFGHDETTGHNYVTMGDYKDAPNGKLKVLNGFRFTGWNTQPNGMGVNYDEQLALDAIGKEPSIDCLTLYARWATNITFDARGGKLAVGSNGTAAEKAAVGKGSASIPYYLHQNIATRLTATKSMYHFVTWNTKPDGSGIDITKYGECKGPVTFYAIYYQSDYAYTGSYQVFTAPVNGTYQIEAWGAKGGNDCIDKNPAKPVGIGANGGYAKGTVKLKRGQTLYVYVGNQGRDNATGTGAGYNGGADSGPHGWSGGGGGATSVSLVAGYWSNPSVLGNRILVAGGGGGGGASGGGGVGGINTRGLNVAGIGGTPYPDGGGGGGGYIGGGAGNGDSGGGGGTSFISGIYGGTVSGFAFTSGQVLSGNQTMPRPASLGGGYMVGNAGACYCYIHLVARD